MSDLGFSNFLENQARQNAANNSRAFFGEYFPSQAPSANTPNTPSALANRNLGQKPIDTRLPTTPTPNQPQLPKTFQNLPGKLGPIAGPAAGALGTLGTFDFTENLAEDLADRALPPESAQEQAFRNFYRDKQRNPVNWFKDLGDIAQGKNPLDRYKEQFEDFNQPGGGIANPSNPEYPNFVDDPLSGGQGPHRYRLTCNIEGWQVQTAQCSQYLHVQESTFWGPISLSLNTTTRTVCGEEGKTAVRVTHWGNGSTRQTSPTTANLYLAPSSGFVIRNILRYTASTERLDGQPDTDGDPPPIPTGTSSPYGFPRTPITAPQAPGTSNPAAPTPTGNPDAPPTNAPTNSPVSPATSSAPSAASSSAPGSAPSLSPPAPLAPPVPALNPPGFPSAPPTASPVNEPTAGRDPVRDAFNLGVNAGIAAAVATVIFNNNGLLESLNPGGGGIGQAPPATKPRCPCNSPVINRMDNLQNAFNAADLGASGLMNSKLDEINTKLGAQIPGGGIASFLQAFRQFADDAWRVLQLDRILSVLTFLTVLHNATFLTREIGETLGWMFSNGLAIVGIRDENDNPLDVNTIVGDSINNYIESVLGTELYNDIREGWAKANRIYQSAANIVWTIRTIQDSAREVLEWTSENVGIIGNALRKWGVVGENAYRAMPETVNAMDAQRARMQRMIDGLETVEDAASSVGGVTSEILEIQEELSELQESKQRFQNEIATLTPDTVRAENQPVATTIATEKIASEAPEVPASDFNKFEPE